MRPPSLQACVRTLEELLELLSGDLEGVLEQAASLNERCHAAMLDCQGLPAGFGATDAERLSLEKLLSREADVLPSLGAHLHVTLSAGTQSGIRYATSVLLSMFSAGSRPGSQSAAAVALFEAGRALLSGCTCLCKAVSVSPTALLHHCQAAQLLHACGNQCVAASAASKGPGSDEHLEIALGQLHSYSQIMGLACSLQLGQLRTDPAAVSAAFPPAVVLPWLASVGEALLAGLQRDPGNVPVLLGAIQVQRTVAEFRFLHAAVGEDSPTLCPDSTLRLLRVALGNLPAALPLLQAAATDSGDGDGEAAAAGPSGGSDGGGSSGSGGGSGSSGGSGGSGGGGTSTFGGFSGRGDAPTWQPWELCKASLDAAHSLPCWRDFLNGQRGSECSSLRQAAVDFLAALPQQRPEAVPDITFAAVHSLATLLPPLFSGMLDACNSYQADEYSLEARAAAAQQAGWQSQQAPWVLQQLPAVVDSLQVVAVYADHDSGQHRLAAGFSVWANALAIIDDSCLQEHATKADELAAWCSSAAAALRLLPTLAAVRVQWPQQTSLAKAAIALGKQCLRLLHDATRAAFSVMRRGAARPRESVRPQWELHSATCRLAHWACTAASADEVAAVAQLHIEQACWEMLSVEFPMLLHALRRAELDREESAVFAAHWEAMLVLLQDDLAAGRLLSKHTRIREAGHLAVFAAAAVEAVPLLATDPRLAQVLKLCFAVLLRAPAGSTGAVLLAKACERLKEGLSDPSFVTLLVAEGVLRQVMEPPSTAEATADIRSCLYGYLRALCHVACP